MEKFIARQPIFDMKRVVYGYELLFRSSTANFFPGLHMDLACVSTADNLFLFGIERLARGHHAFINCSRDFLVRDYAGLLPKDRVVVEILENTEPDREVIDAVKRLKHRGFTIALDDFVEVGRWGDLVDLADFIKVDFLATPPDAQYRFCREFSRRNIRMLAEKVETYADFDRARTYGYAFVQGYFFSRPEILTRHDIPANKINYVRVLQAVTRPELDRDEVAERIKAEASLSYRLLRYLNSPAFFLASEVRSIPHALMLLGDQGIRRWVSLVAMACMGEDKPQELLLLPLMRARFCELLASFAGQRESANDLFLLGLLSAIDAILDMKMEDVLKEITLRAEIREALLGNANSFRRIYDVVLAFERAAWDEFDKVSGNLSLSKDAISEMHVQSMEWAATVLAGGDVKETVAT